MSKIYSREEVVDILDILYIKILNLRNSWKSCAIIAMNPNLNNNFPDITDGIKRSFAVDAYTTIEGLLVSGKYSFQSLIFNEDFQKEFSNSKTKIKSVIPNLDDKRNQMICHFNEKQDPQVYDLIVVKYYLVDEELCNLHKKAMEIFGVNFNEIRAMCNDKFERLSEEYLEFGNILSNAILNYDLDKLHK